MSNKSLQSIAKKKIYIFESFGQSVKKSNQTQAKSSLIVIQMKVIPPQPIGEGE